MPRLVTDNHNVDLIKEFFHEEIKTATFQMDPMKHQGLMGLDLLFFQYNWKIMGLRFVTQLDFFLRF